MLNQLVDHIVNKLKNRQAELNRTFNDIDFVDYVIYCLRNDLQTQKLHKEYRKSDKEKSKDCIFILRKVREKYNSGN